MIYLSVFSLYILYIYEKVGVLDEDFREKKTTVKMNYRF